MGIKKTKLSKRLSKRLSKSKQYRKTKHMKTSKQRLSLKSKKVFKSKKNSNSKNRRHYKSNSKQNLNKYKHTGGFNFNSGDDCNLATIKEPGFNLEGSGDIKGISIPEARAVIYNPDCKVDTYQAMIPYN